MEVDDEIGSVESKVDGVGDRLCSVFSRSHWDSIKDSPHELWIVFVLKLLSSYSYFSFALVLTLFLSTEFQMSDVEAGWVYGLYGMLSNFSVALGFYQGFAP